MTRTQLDSHTEQMEAVRKSFSDFFYHADGPFVKMVKAGATVMQIIDAQHEAWEQWKAREGKV